MMKLVLSSVAAGVFAIPLAYSADQAQWQHEVPGGSNATYLLQRLAEPIADPMELVQRNVTLVTMLSPACPDLVVNTRALTSCVKSSGILALSRDAQRDAAEAASQHFAYWDRSNFAHLCSSSDFLFGRSGVLIKGILSTRGKPQNEL